MKKINAVIFDFGRVISAQKPATLFATYERDLGLAPNTINPIMFDSPEWEAACLGHIGAREFWYAIGPKLGLKSRKAIDDFRTRYHADESINPEVKEIMEALHGRYRLAVLSNNPPGLKPWLADWGLLHLFSAVFCSGDEGMMKPDPQAFKVTLHRLGIAPDAAVFIDDTMEHVKAAQALGMHAIHFTSAPELKAALSVI